tara:strand:- start:16 stop:498 length:483 start_codon:yes stop_codon:yes gene_type:complete
MAVENLSGTIRGVDATHGVGEGGTLKSKTVTVEISAAASATSTYFQGKLRIPSAARISGMSKINLDDLASSGSPTLDAGLFAVNSNITSDDDALNDGIDAASAGSVSLIKDISNYGKKAYEFVSGQTSDPQGELDVVVTIKDAATNTGGTVTIELFYTID